MYIQDYTADIGFMNRSDNLHDNRKVDLLFQCLDVCFACDDPFGNPWNACRIQQTGNRFARQKSFRRIIDDVPNGVFVDSRHVDDGRLWPGCVVNRGQGPAERDLIGKIDVTGIKEVLNFPAGVNQGRQYRVNRFLANFQLFAQHFVNVGNIKQAGAAKNHHHCIDLIELVFAVIDDGAQLRCSTGRQKINRVADRGTGVQL